MRRAWNDIPVVYQSFEYPGDFNADRGVDGRDLLAWQRGQSGDVAGDAGRKRWERHFSIAAPNELLASIAVPEPSQFTQALAVLYAYCRLRLNRRDFFAR